MLKSTEYVQLENLADGEYFNAMPLVPFEFPTEGSYKVLNYARCINQDTGAEIFLKPGQILELDSGEAPVADEAPVPTKAELKAKLDELGVEYRKKATVSELMELLDASAA